MIFRVFLGVLVIIGVCYLFSSEVTAADNFSKSSISKSVQQERLITENNIRRSRQSSRRYDDWVTRSRLNLGEYSSGQGNSGNYYRRGLLGLRRR